MQHYVAPLSKMVQSVKWEQWSVWSKSQIFRPCKLSSTDTQDRMDRKIQLTLHVFPSHLSSQSNVAVSFTDNPAIVVTSQLILHLRSLRGNMLRILSLLGTPSKTSYGMLKLLKPSVITLSAAPVLALNPQESRRLCAPVVENFLVL